MLKGFLLTLTILMANMALGATLPSARSVQSQLVQELSLRYPGAKVELDGTLQWAQGTAMEVAKRVEITSENARGELRFRSQNGNSISEGVSRYSVWMPAWIAVRRIMPGEKLRPTDFQLQEVNVIVGQARDLRGLILSPASDLTGQSLTKMESRQTILEGSMLTTNAVQSTPDVRRGDAVTIRMISGDLELTTQGIVQEPGVLNNSVRVMSGKTKKEFVGKLADKGIVEVRL